MVSVNFGGAAQFANSFHILCDGILPCFFLIPNHRGRGINLTSCELPQERIFRIEFGDIQAKQSNMALVMSLRCYDGSTGSGRVSLAVIFCELIPLLHNAFLRINDTNFVVILEYDVCILQTASAEGKLEQKP